MVVGYLAMRAIYSHLPAIIHWGGVDYRTTRYAYMGLVFAAVFYAMRGKADYLTIAAQAMVGFAAAFAIAEHGCEVDMLIVAVVAAWIFDKKRLIFPLLATIIALEVADSGINRSW